MSYLPPLHVESGGLIREFKCDVFGRRRRKKNKIWLQLGWLEKEENEPQFFGAVFFPPPV